MRDAPQMVDVSSGPLVCINSLIYGSRENLGVFCNLFSKNVVHIQLLTYTPDEGHTSEDFEPSHEEHEPSLLSDSIVVPSEETQPPPSAETAQNIVDTDDLLVKYAYYINFDFSVMVFLLSLILSVLLTGSE